MDYQELLIARPRGCALDDIAPRDPARRKFAECLARIALDFVVYDENSRQSIAHFGRESEPLNVVLLLDVSGSMRPVLSEMYVNVSLRPVAVPLVLRSRCL